MSLQSWKDVFYSTGAEEFEGLEGTPENELSAVEHCIKKWEGLSTQNLKNHNLYMGYYRINDNYYRIKDGFYQIKDSDFRVSSETCALCNLHNNCCRDCVLYDYGYDCDVSGSPYDVLDYEGPQPMIDALNECKQALENKIGTKQAY